MKIFKHTETGKPYLVLCEIEIKNPTTREWAPGVLYKPLYGDRTKTYARDLVDFTKHFTEINDDGLR